MGMSVMDILRLMNGGQTPTENPVYGYKQTDDPNGPNVILDSQGTPVYDPDRVKQFQSAQKGGYVDKPYKPITGLAATFNPEAANFVAQNNTAGVRAQSHRNITRGLTGQDLATLPRNYFPNPNLDNNANITLSGGNTSAVGLQGEQAASENILKRLPVSTALLGSVGNEANIQAAKNRLMMEQGESNRMPTAEAIRDSDVVNQLTKSLDLDPLVVQHSRNVLKGELGRDPDYNELQNFLLKNQQKTANIDSGLLDTKEQALPLLRRTLGNSIIGQAYESNFLPTPTSPYGMRINMDGTISGKPQRMPGYVNLTDSMRAKMDTSNGDIAPGIRIPTRDIDAATGLPIDGPKKEQTKIAYPSRWSVLGQNQQPVQTMNAAPVQEQSSTGAFNGGIMDLLRTLGNKMKSNPSDVQQLVHRGFAGYKRADGTIIKHGDPDEFPKQTQ